jgi:hypothetical protein
VKFLLSIDPENTAKKYSLSVTRFRRFSAFCGTATHRKFFAELIAAGRQNLSLADNMRSASNGMGAMAGLSFNRGSTSPQRKPSR